MNKWLTNLRQNLLLSLNNPFWQKNWLFLIIGLLLTSGTSYYAYTKFDSPTDTFPIQILCFLIAFLWVLFIVRSLLKSHIILQWQFLRIHPAWLLVLSAIILRCFMLTIFPPTNQTGFEEIQTGSIAYRIFLHYELPLEFRFTNLLASLGFSSGSGINLSSLRFPFIVTGILSIILIVFSLRSLKVHWIPTLLITFIAATLRFLVIASGVADELFASIPLLAALCLFIIKIEESEENQPFWAALAGIVAGMLLFEYTSYRVPAAFVFVFLLWKCFSTRKALKVSHRSSKCLNLFSFIFTLVLIGLPTLIQTIHNPSGNIFLEAFRRHGEERSTFFSLNSLYQMQQYILGLTGWPSGVSAYYTPVNDPVILEPIGWLFGISLIYSLIFSRRGVIRGFSITVLAVVVSAGLLANNANIGRMAPTLPLLLIMAGVLLNDLYIKILAWVSKNRLGKGNISDYSSPHWNRKERNHFTTYSRS